MTRAPRVVNPGKRAGIRPAAPNERPCKICGGPMLPGPNVTICPDCAPRPAQVLARIIHQKLVGADQAVEIV
jgi:hypothetical protein